jgi:autotransporter-associated beta strand protein
MTAATVRSCRSFVQCKRSRALFSAVFVTVLASVSHDACAQFTFATDNASNYGGSWTDNSNGGSGFSAWDIVYGNNTGTFIGNPSNDGMGTTGIGTTAFGLYATGGAYVDAFRGGFTLNVGDTMSFYWAMNFDANSGSKGFDFRVGDTGVFNVNNGNSTTISTTTGNATTVYGTTPMFVTLTRNSGTQYGFSMTSKSGGSTYSSTFDQSSAVNNLKIYIGNQNDGAGQRNIYFNNFAVTNSGVYSVTQTESRALTGSGNLVVSSSSTLTLSANNDFTGTTTVQTGSTLVLGASGTGDEALGGTASVSIGGVGAKLLISQSEQVSNTATVSLSGGTIQRASGVNETFGNLSISGASTLDFGSGAATAGTLQFQTYSNSGNSTVTVSNFSVGNKLQFLSSHFNSGNLAQFSFSNGYTTSTEGSYFTITAIPEPSTYVAAAGLLAMFLWPVRRRMIKDIKSILGLRPTGRERIEAYRNV